MSSSVEKGNALEQAVTAVETAILRSSPSLRRNTFIIENKKLIVVDGVRHEIDIYVTVDFGNGYKSIFIFECKNREDAVGKNDIIVFAEKIAVTGAQKGFFVAKSFTRDAIAQANNNIRIERLLTTAENVNEIPVPFNIHLLDESGRWETEFAFITEDRTKLVPYTRFADVQVRGFPDPQAYLLEWVSGACKAWIRKFPSDLKPEGCYSAHITEIRHFAPAD